MNGLDRPAVLCTTRPATTRNLKRERAEAS